MSFGRPCPVSDLFGVAGRELLASLELIDSLEARVPEINSRLPPGGAEHPYVPRLLTVPGIGSVLAFTIAAEIGDVSRFATPTKPTGCTGLCPRVVQSGELRERRSNDPVLPNEEAIET
jgi:transposase